ncbi:tetratricopeptide repeat protein [Microvirga sp. 2TAF3]|uniref:tetratricopeptide repeat protein n=1 Tax=Microvirga sp. 2TAF3 TaxID=3233014 RepID=UPI003F9BD215
MKASIKFILLAATVLLAGCQSMDVTGRARVDGIAATEEQYVSTDQPQRLGREHFARANYALAERYFQAAVERTPQDGESWMGLAASYDQLGRFDLADRAYEQAAGIKGNTPQLLNNRGYSYLLRGDSVQAELLFRQALSANPDDAIIQNNIALVKRAKLSR